MIRTREEFEDAVQNGDARGVEHALKRARTEIDPTEDNYYALQLATSMGHADVTRAILADPRVKPPEEISLEILSSAIHSGYPESVIALLDSQKVDPGINENEALYTAVEIGVEDIVEILLNDPRIDLSADGNKLLHIAADYDHIGIVRKLVDHMDLRSPAFADETINSIIRERNERLFVGTLSVHETSNVPAELIRSVISFAYRI